MKTSSVHITTATTENLLKDDKWASFGYGFRVLRGMHLNSVRV
jgi:hypothetical protein